MKEYQEYIRHLEVKYSKDNDYFFDFEGTPFDEECSLFFPFAKGNFSYVLSEFGITDADFYFKNDTRINARATRVDDNYHIEINSGILKALKDLFVLKESEIKEVVSKLSLNNILAKIDVPINELFYQGAILFLYYHEMAHLIQFKDNSNFSLIEIDNNKTFDILNHALELDADIYAAILMVKHISKYWKKLEENEQTLENYYSLLAGTAVSSVMLLLALTQFENEIYYEEKDHPHGMVRFLAIYHTMIEFSIIELSNNGLRLDYKMATETLFNYFDSFFPSLTSNSKFNMLKDHYSKEKTKILEYYKKLFSIIRNDKNMALVKRNIIAKEKESNA